MTAFIPPRCLCSHSRYRHRADRYACCNRACGCIRYRAAGCLHAWIELGGPGDEWHECDLCGATED